MMNEKFLLWSLPSTSAPQIPSIPAQSAQMSKNQLRRKISGDTLFTTYTRTGDALKYVMERFQNEARMDDPKVTKYLMVLTDGRSTGQSQMIKDLSDKLWAMNITCFAIGVGQNISPQELDFISHGQQHLRFEVKMEY